MNPFRHFAGLAAAALLATMPLTVGAQPIRLGERVMLTPSHCDPTVDRFDWYVGVRNGRVECLWPVAARGGLS